MSEAEKAEDSSKLKQPRIFVVGTDTENLKYFVSLATNKYYANTICEAVEIAMFFFLGLDLKYPTESQTIWELFQHLIFGVKVSNVGQQLQELIEKVGKI